MFPMSTRAGVLERDRTCRGLSGILSGIYHITPLYHPPWSPGIVYKLVHPIDSYFVVDQPLVAITRRSTRTRNILDGLWLDIFYFFFFNCITQTLNLLFPSVSLIYRNVWKNRRLKIYTKTNNRPTFNDQKRFCSECKLRVCRLK